MWRPGFEFIESRPALARGRHRRLCVYSHVHRGTREKPGLVFGLDNGGTCRGLAFRIEEKRWPDTIAYLRERELVTDVYLERSLSVEIDHGDKINKVQAVTYIVDRAHPQYAGRLSAEELFALAHRAEGKSGSTRDYVASAAAFLKDVNWRDYAIENLHHALQQAGAYHHNKAG